MKTASFLRIYATRLAFFLAVVALLLFIPASLTASVGLRIFLSVLIVLLLIGGGILLFLGNRRGAQVHYFLYDRRRARKKPREELSAEGILEDVSFYLRPFVEDDMALWQDLPKPLRLQLEGEPQFRPLVMYRMLYLLSLCDEERIYSVFSSASERVVTYVCRSIADGGDNEMADYVYHLKKRADRERICIFFQKNTACCAARALRFVEQNFEDFFVQRSRLSK